VTLHGFALNCSTDLSWYGAIVPCGLEDRGVTSLTDIAGREITVEQALPAVAERFAEVFHRRFTRAPREVLDLLRTEPAAAAG
jgi:lipoyl(octanoyl) transferase